MRTGDTLPVAGIKIKHGPLHPYPPTLQGLWWRVRDAFAGNRYVACKCGCSVYIGPGPLELWQCTACNRLLDALSQGVLPK